MSNVIESICLGVYTYYSSIFYQLMSEVAGKRVKRKCYTGNVPYDTPVLMGVLN